MTILDPACGSGNFLYVALKKLKDLEQEVLIYFEDHGFGKLLPFVGPRQLLGLEISPYAFDLAQMTVWIGYLQWQRSNGYRTFGEPVLQRLDTFRCMDSVLDLTDPSTPKEPEWPEAEFIVGNPPFLGAKKFRSNLGDAYTDSLFGLYGNRIPNFSDLCCYWFEKARDRIEAGFTSRVGLLATQGIRGGLNCEVLQRIKRSGDIFMAWSNREWVLDGANVGVSIIGFDKGDDKIKNLDGNLVTSINPDLTASTDITKSKRLAENQKIGFYADVKAGKFDIPITEALGMLTLPNPNGKPNSDVIRPWSNGRDVVQRPSDRWIIDFGVMMSEVDACLYEAPYQLVKARVEPERRKAKRDRYNKLWWIHAEPCGEMRIRITARLKFLATTIVSKHRLFVWMTSMILPDHALFVVARDDDFAFGVLHSRIHETWSLRQGTFLEDRPRYTPTTCFETFPFPMPTEAQRSAIAEAARDLDALRSRWLNPPEWTRQEILEFPGSVDGPWSRFVHDPDARGIGTVRYPVIKPGNSAIAKNLAERTLTNLYNKPPAWLEAAHRKLDAAVFAAYGWEPSLSDDEILARLLALNLERADASGPTPRVVKVNDQIDDHE